MVRSIFSKLNNFVKWLYHFLLSTPSLLKKQSELVTTSFWEFRYNINNFGEANTNLGIYHLNNGHYNDAIFRFKLAHRFSRNQDTLINYWLGWVYFLKKNYKQAIIHLQQAKDTDKIDLLKFVETIDSDNDSIKTVPDPIYTIHKSIIAGDIIAKFVGNNEHDLPQSLVVQLIASLGNLVEVAEKNKAKKYTILELGSNIGLVGQSLAERMSEEFTLTGTEKSAQMIYLQKTSGRDDFYDQIVNLSNNEFLSSSKELYDIVLSLDGFANNADLADIFSKIYKVLAAKGCFAFIVRISSALNFSKQYLEFSYNKNYINEVLQQQGFKIIANNDLGNFVKNNYSIFICTKQ